MCCSFRAFVHSRKTSDCVEWHKEHFLAGASSERVRIIDILLRLRVTHSRCRWCEQLHLRVWCWGSQYFPLQRRHLQPARGCHCNNIFVQNVVMPRHLINPAACWVVCTYMLLAASKRVVLNVLVITGPPPFCKCYTCSTPTCVLSDSLWNVSNCQHCSRNYMSIDCREQWCLK